MRILNTVDAVREGHRLLLAESQNNIIIGEGCGDPKACFGTIKNLHLDFPNQVFDCPVSENGVIGVCIGASLGGMRPIHLNMRQDFLLYAMDQIVNNAAKWNSMFGGNGGNASIVVKAFTGRGWGSGHQHSQNLESLFAHIPGLKVLVPSCPRNAKGLLLAAHRDPNPCIILEDRWIHHLEGQVDEGWEETKIDEIDVVFGEANYDETVLVWGQLVSEAVKAANILRGHDIRLRVIDLQTLSSDAVRAASRFVMENRIHIFQNAWDQGAFAHTAAAWFEDPHVHTIQHCYPSSTPALTKNYYIDATRIAEVFGVHIPRPEHHDIPDKSFTGPF